MDNKSRFLAKVRVNDNGCWEWTANVNPNGYGMFWWNGRKDYAHQFAYETYVGPTKQGFDIDHKCRNRKCVNPKHLELVTHSENQRRGLLGVLRKLVQTHCKHGHPFDETNTKLNPQGHRLCIICDRERKARWNRNHHEYCARKANERYHKNIDRLRKVAREYQRKKRIEKKGG